MIRLECPWSPTLWPKIWRHTLRHLRHSLNHQYIWVMPGLINVIGQYPFTHKLISILCNIMYHDIIRTVSFFTVDLVWLDEWRSIRINATILALPLHSSWNRLLQMAGDIVFSGFRRSLWLCKWLPDPFASALCRCLGLRFCRQQPRWKSKSRHVATCTGQQVFGLNYIFSIILSPGWDSRGKGSLIPPYPASYHVSFCRCCACDCVVQETLALKCGLCGNFLHVPTKADSRESRRAQTLG